ncbi:MAG: glycosyltransferase family 4 protein [Pseudomonadota bacterium]
MSTQSTAAAISDAVVIPDNAGALIRQRLGLGPDEPLRISYVPGPGDLSGTFEHWRKSEFDPRSPSLAYSTMFFELMRRLDADAQVVMRGDQAMSFDTTDRVSFSRIPMKPMNNLIGYWRSMLDFSLKTRSEIAKFDPHITIVVSNFFWAAFPALRLKGSRLVLTVHCTCWPVGMTNLPLQTRIENIGRSLGLVAVNSAVCISPECARQVQQLSVGRQIPAHVAFHQQIRRWEGADGVTREIAEGDDFHFIYLGRIEEYKGVFDLLEAFKRVHAQNPKTRLTLAGRGAHNDRLTAELERDSLGGAVTYLGQLDWAGVHQLLESADALVCPTRTDFCEGSPAVCYEAATHGVPVVASTVVPSAVEELSEGCLVFPADDVAGLTEALSRVATDADLRKKLSTEIGKCGDVLFDRSQSWGSNLYRALLDATPAPKQSDATALQRA